jgi:glycosyltransferase involved in cell wall biosynthesis
MPSPRIAVLIPCYNEEVAIADTVAGFRAALPTAIVYVYDNNSRDRTSERTRGVMDDGDLTYDPKVAPKMIDLFDPRQSGYGDRETGDASRISFPDTAFSRIASSSRFRPCRPDSKLKPS